MVLAILLLLFLGLLGYVLLMPLELCIDSSEDQYFLRLGILGRIAVEKDPVEVLRLHLKVLFLDFFWRPSDFRKWGPQKKQSDKKQKVGKQRRMTLAQGRKLLESFRIKTFRLEVDTGNPVLNAQLFPLFFLIRPHTGDVGINFLGRNHISLKVVNRPIYILNAFINPKK